MQQYKAIVAGIDIGATNTILGLVDREGHCFQHELLKTDAYETAGHFIDGMARKIHHALEAAGQQYKLLGIGIGAPNGNYQTGTIENAANLPWKEKIPLAEKLAEYFDVPVKLTNDANAAAMGEMLFGAARGMKDFIMITLGTGLGSGIVVNGQLVYGHDGYAGELGHVIAVPGGRLCGCGRKGCLETYASATGITRTVREMLETSATKSLLRNLPAETLDSRKIYDAACAGDSVALQAFDLTCQVLGLSLANAVAFSSPEAIILFGGLAKAAEFILEPLQKQLEDQLLFVYKNKVRILQSLLPENDAAILGAAALIWNP